MFSIVKARSKKSCSNFQFCFLFWETNTTYCFSGFHRIPDVYPYCKSNGYGNNDATAHCCLKFKYVYNTTCIIDPLSAINTCAWSYNHIISGWVMHAAMATCCGSMNSQIDYVVGKPLDQMPRCPNV